MYFKQVFVVGRSALFNVGLNLSMFFFLLFGVFSYQMFGILALFKGSLVAFIKTFWWLKFSIFW